MKKKFQYENIYIDRTGISRVLLNDYKLKSFEALSTPVDNLGTYKIIQKAPTMSGKLFYSAKHTLPDPCLEMPESAKQRRFPLSSHIRGYAVGGWYS